MKKPWFLALLAVAVAVILLALAACGAEATPTPTPRPPTPTPVPATATPTARPATPTPAPVPPTPTPAPPTATPRPGTTPVPATVTPTPVPPTATPTRVPTATPTPRPITGFSDAEWAKIVDAAKKEGKVMCYCWRYTDAYGKSVKDGFKAAFGIDLEFINGPTGTLVERARSEIRAGVFSADIVQGVGLTILSQLDELDYLQPLDALPVFRNVDDRSVWYYSPLLTPRSVMNYGSALTGGGNYMVSTKLVSPERMPKKFQDLLDPWWKGQICMVDPLTSTVPNERFWEPLRSLGYPEWYIDLWYDMGNKDAGRFFLHALGATERAMAQGDCAISLSSAPAAPAAVKDWAEVRGVSYFKVGTWDPPMAPMLTIHLAGVLKKAAHPNAALVFENWVNTKEAQQLFIAANKDQYSVRKDAPTPVEEKYYSVPAVQTFWQGDPKWLSFEGYSYARRSLYKLIKEGQTRDAWKREVKEAASSFWGQWPPPAAEIRSVSERGQ